MSTSMTEPSEDVVALWASARISYDTKDFPEYGSTEWRGLPPDDPKRLAAALEAAEKWRRAEARSTWLEQLAETAPDVWYREITREADQHARRLLQTLKLSRLPTATEMRKRREKCGPVHQLRATPSWPPIAIPGQPGEYLTDNEQERAA